MAERSVCRPWTEHEDTLLKEGVSLFGDQDHWKDIAQRVPNRTNKACRKRWLHSLSPSVKKCAWSSDEDRLLIRLYEDHGSKWSLIARHIPGRTDDACSKRYRESLDPVLKKEAWTPEEDTRLLDVYTSIGSKWSQVGQELGRGGLDCRNRWRLLERKRLSGRACPYGSPRQTRSPNKSAATLEASQSQDPSSSGELAPLTPSSFLISIQEPQDSYWNPNFPAGFYSTNVEVVSRTPSFAEGHPEAPEFSYAQAARYQSSTSSLSAALSAPPAPSRPLPPDSLSHFAHPTTYLFSHSQPASQTTSPLFTSNASNNTFYDDFAMSLGDYGMDNMDQHNDLVLSNTDYSQPLNGEQQHQPPVMATLSFPDDSIFQSAVSPISPSVVSLPPSDTLFFGDAAWKSPLLSSLWSGGTPQLSGTPQFSPASLAYGISSTASEPLPLPELSSAASTPFPISASISPASPNTDIQGDLPNGPNISDFGAAGVSPPGGGSLLFSSSDPQAPAKKKRRAATRIRPETAATARLSSILKLSEDPNVRPYACGHDLCWPLGKDASISCFQTSKDLCDHHREFHGQTENCDKLFRCGLKGCDKSWKSVNGLQYHLQISTVHFKDAVQRRYEDDNSLQQMSSAPPGSTDLAEGEDSDRRYPCIHPNCFKAYKQPSGLRYHMKHGHPTDLPVQLADVPPALERELPKKAKKMRFRKGTDDFSPSPAHPGAMAAAAGLAAAAASFTPAPAAAVPLPTTSSASVQA